jgi:hypothetical protein
MPLPHSRQIDPQAAPAAVVVNAVLANPARRAALLSAFCEALEFDRAAAPLLLHAGASDAGPRAIEPVQQCAPRPALVHLHDAMIILVGWGCEPHCITGLVSVSGVSGMRKADLLNAAATAGDGKGAAAHPPDTAPEAAGLPHKPGAQTSTQAHEQAAAALPRFPMGLTYVGSRQPYAALATAMRMTGRLAVSAAAGCCHCCEGCPEEPKVHSHLPRCPYCRLSVLLSIQTNT